MIHYYLFGAKITGQNWNYNLVGFFLNLKKTGEQSNNEAKLKSHLSMDFNAQRTIIGIFRKKYR